MTRATVEGWLSRIEWQDLRDWWRSPSIRFMRQLMGLFLLGYLAFAVMPTPFQFFVKLYITFMFMSLTVGMLAGARGWLVWVVGTVLFSLGLNALFVWHLTTLTPL